MLTQLQNPATLLTASKPRFPKIVTPFNPSTSFQLKKSNLSFLGTKLPLSLTLKTTQTKHSTTIVACCSKRVVSFNDVVGIDHVKNQLQGILEYFKNLDHCKRLGARPPSCLLVGPPGTGKTLLANAISREAEVPLFSYIHNGIVHIKDLFARAKELPSIILIEGIDTMGKRDLRELFTEMDRSYHGVVVLATTNRGHLLDQELFRAGRFGRVVMVDPPYKLGRQAMLKFYVGKKKVPLGDDVDLAEIASMTAGLNGADLEWLVNEAAWFAVKQKKAVVEMSDFFQAVEKWDARSRMISRQNFVN